MQILIDYLQNDMFKVAVVVWLIITFFMGLYCIKVNAKTGNKNINWDERLLISYTSFIIFIIVFVVNIFKTIIDNIADYGFSYLEKEYS